MRINDFSAYLHILRQTYADSIVLDMIEKVSWTIESENRAGHLLPKGIEWSDAELSLYEIFRF